MRPERISGLGALGFLFATFALARAGGGQHYSGGHSSYSTPSRSGNGSFSGGSSPSGRGSTYVYAPSAPASGETSPVLLVIELVVLIAVIALIRKANRRSRLRPELPGSPRDPRRTLSPDPDSLRRLAQSDPGFDRSALLEKAERIFRLLQTAWFKRDLAPVRRYISDANFQRLSVQLHLLAIQGVRNAIDGVEVRRIGLIGLERSHLFDTAHVRIDASMRDLDLPADWTDDQCLAKVSRQPPQPFTEVWSFVRRVGAKTHPDKGELKCPNCGAPFGGGSTNQCEYCDAIVNSGQFDWTLFEITQGIEYAPHPPTVPGMVELQRRDPAINLEMLEDRSSLLFWKWIDARCRAQPQALLKVATPGFIEGHCQPQTFADCAVGSVDVLSFALDREGFDQAKVEIRWSARIGGASEPIPQRWIFTLGRKVGSQTNAKSGMATSRCPHCSAPLTDSASPSCDHCGTLLSDAGLDWVLVWAEPVDPL